MTDLISKFREHFYLSNVWQDTWFQGRRVLKPPSDLHAYHEIIWEKRPNFLVECGTFEGGSALFFAEQLSSLQVITVDINACAIDHPRVQQIVGSSADQGVADCVRDIVGDAEVMVVLDSDHRPGHVARELELFSSMVTPGQYLIVEDTFSYDYGGAQNHLAVEVVAPFLAEHPEFLQDARPERFGLTFHPGGWLLRGRQALDD